MTHLKFTLHLVAVIALMLFALGPAYFSVTGWAVIFPAEPVLITGFGIGLETTKLATVYFILTVCFSHRGREVASRYLFLPVALVVGLGLISTVSVYAQLAWHVRHSGVTDLFGLWPGEKAVIFIAVIFAFCGPLALALAAVFGEVRRRAA